MDISILVFGFITAFLVVLLATPSLIKVAKLKHLVDEPSEARKVHKKRIPTIGGIIIFSSILFSYALWFPDANMDTLEFSEAIKQFKYIVACLLILFFVGVKDDIIGTAPVKKLAAHMIVAFILVIMANIKITNMQGLFGVTKDLPDYVSVLLSFFVYVVIVNAMNLIDGLDGLAGGVGLICGGLFAGWFAMTGNLPLALLSVTLVGALLGFLVFNFSPAKIFMGDSGSLTIGATISVLAINAIETPHELIIPELGNISVPVLVMAILVYPLIDTLRVFTMRALKGRSPFSADRNHLHHKLTDLGLNHKKTVIIIYSFNLLVVGATLVLGLFLNPTLQLICTVIMVMAIIQIPLFLHKKKFAK